jgi:hypothetical protein
VGDFNCAAPFYSAPSTLEASGRSLLKWLEEICIYHDHLVSNNLDNKNSLKNPNWLSLGNDELHRKPRAPHRKKDKNQNQSRNIIKKLMLKNRKSP